MMTLYSSVTCHYSHRCRFLLQEKEIEANIADVEINRKPPELAQFNPYGEVPVLVDKDLVLYESSVINEYLNDRFPHPELLPIDIVQKARVRLLTHVFQRDLYDPLDILINRRSAESRKKDARESIVRGLLQLSHGFKESGYKYLMGQALTLGDVALAPLLWRLPEHGIKLPKRALPLMTYAQRVFSREGFIRSLTLTERRMGG